MTAPRPRPVALADHGQQGLALVTVIVVLVALVLIATPFAVSMRNLESSALLGRSQVQARAGARLAVAAATRQLADTHPALDLQSPHVDRRAELLPDDLAERFKDLLPRDPRGAVRSVTVADESGKVHLGTASLSLLGNLLGGRTVLAEPLLPADGGASVASAEGFAPSGLVFVGREQMEYSSRSNALLGELRRGYGSANFESSSVSEHGAGDEVLDARLLLLVQRAWHLHPGTYQPFTRVDGLRDLSLFAEMTYDAATLDRVRHELTVHGGAPVWRNAQRVLALEEGADGAPVLIVSDGSHYGQGAVVRLQAADGELRHDLVLEAVQRSDGWALTLLEGGLGRGWEDGTVLRCLAPVPVNVNSASTTVLAALLEGLGRPTVLDVISDDEAVLLALLSQEWSLSPGSREFASLARDELAAGSFSQADAVAAGALFTELRLRPGELSAAQLAMALTGRRTLRSSSRISKLVAGRMAALIHEGEPGSHEELRGLLDGAVAEGELSELHRQLILRNAIDPYDAQLIGGTAPFCYDSAGLFTVVGASSENHPNGRERSRAQVRQVISVAPPGESARLLSTQADFEAARRQADGDDGWVSHPRALKSGPGLAVIDSAPDPGATAAPRAQRGGLLALGDDELFADLGEQQRLAELGTGRAETLIAGRPGPSTDESRSFFTPQTVRSALPGTMHFDEGAWGLTGSSPDGWDTADGPLRLDPHALPSPVVSPLTERVQPFAIEFWFTLEDVGAETVLFDAGADALEDRIMIMMKAGELILRVSDHSLADVDAELPEGSLPPAGEIRYSFDDGLSLEAGVPYHLAAWVGGAKDSRLALFIDGVARGQRRFTTHLTADVDAAGGTFMGSNAGQGKERLAVESAGGFPARGVLRVGNEIMEYTSHDESSFLVAASGSDDPFGGRGKRGTGAIDHEATEIVELLGYSMPLASLVASRGNGALVDDLAPFTLAELDPTALVAPIDVNPLLDGVLVDVPFQVGTGLSPDAIEIPVRGLDGSALTSGVFSSGGGYALLFNDLGFDAVAGQKILPETGGGNQWTLPPETFEGFPLGGAELIFYDSYSDGMLHNVARGGDPDAVPDSLHPGQASELDGAADPWVDTALSLIANHSYTENHAFVSSFSNHMTSELSSLPVDPEYSRTLVIPLSIAIDDGLGVYDGFHPQRTADSYLLQIGLDFPEGGGGTEWVRWDIASSRDMVVRDDLNGVEQMLSVLSADGGLGAWQSAVTIDQTVLDQLNQGLGFRGQDGTPDTSHLAGDQVLPVILFGEWGLSDFGAISGVPGRHDFVTLIEADGTREWNTINHGVHGDSDYPNSCLVGFRQAVFDDFSHSQTLDDEAYLALDLLDIEASLEPGQAGERLMNELELSDQSALAEIVKRFSAESRRITRLVKAPSGELPALPPGKLHLGEDFDRQPSAGRATLDELRFHVDPVPGPLMLPTVRYVLDQELEFDEDEVLLLRLTELHFVQGKRRASLFGPERLEIMGELPASGGLLLVGEEIVAYAGYDHLDSGAMFLAARGLYGTRRAFHPRGSPVVPLSFWPAVPLAESLSESGFLIPVAEPGVFPAAGGLLRVDDELLAYDRVEQDGLSMATSQGRRPEGLARARFGTLAAEHRAGSLVRWQPARYVDGSDVDASMPEAGLGRLTINAPGAFFSDVTLRVAPLDPAVELVGQAVLDRRAGPVSQAERDSRVTTVKRSSKSADQFVALPRHHGDRLDILLGVRWNLGAFDPTHGASNGWKLAPVLRDVVVRHLQPTLVLEHEEWR